jgi:hypothetical protein
METIELQVSPELAQRLRQHTDQLPQILEWGLRHLEQEQGLLEADIQRRRVREALQTAGLSLSRSASPSTAGLLSSGQRAELSRRFSAGRPLSELITEEREDR